MVNLQRMGLCAPSLPLLHTISKGDGYLQSKCTP